MYQFQWFTHAHAHAHAHHRKPTDVLSQEIKKDREGYERSIKTATSIDPEDEYSLEELTGIEGYEAVYHDVEEELSPTEKVIVPLYPIAEGEGGEEEGGREELTSSIAKLTPEEHPSEAKRPKLRHMWRKVAEKSLEESSSFEDPPNLSEATPTSAPNPEDSITSTGSGWNRPVKIVRISEGADAKGRPKQLRLMRRKSFETPFLREGETHRVWRPKKRPELANLVEQLQRTENKTGEPGLSLGLQPPPITAQPPKPPSSSSLTLPVRTPSLRSRQKTLFNHVTATQAVLKESTDELINTEEEEQGAEPVSAKKKGRGHISLLDASRKVTTNSKKQKLQDEASF